MIGFVDYDLLQSNGLGVPNVEIMKLSSYYKVEKNQACRLITELREGEDTSIYEKIYFCSERGELNIPNSYKSADNVEFIGTNFTNGVYVPFEDSLIDYTIPRTTIYKNFLAMKSAEGIKAKEINNFLDNTYYRMHAGDQMLMIPPMVKNKKIYLFDRDAFFDGWEERLEDIVARKPSTIMRIHPIFCRNLSQFFSLRKMQKFSRAAEIVLDINIPLSDVFIMFKKYELKFLSEIMKTSNIMLPLGGEFLTKEGYYRNLIYTLNLLYSFWARGIPIKLYKKEQPAYAYNPIDKLSKLIVTWASVSTSIEQPISILERIGKREQEYEELKGLVNYFPESRKLFDQKYKNLTEGRFWRL